METERFNQQVEPKMMSVYREEAIDALISCLKDSNFPNSQLLAAETIWSLQGRFSHSGRPLLRSILLKLAGMSKSYRALLRTEQFGYVLEDPDENLVSCNFAYSHSPSPTKYLCLLILFIYFFNVIFLLGL